MKRGNKKGQFYLLAAIVIIVLITGFAAISNYAKKKGSVKLYDIKDELQIEGGEVLEYGVYTDDSQIGDFIGKYQEYAGEDKELYFIYGNFGTLDIISFKEEGKGEISVGVGNGQSGIEIYETVGGKRTLSDPGANVFVNISGIEYPFKLKEGENFFFIISQEVEGEQHIVTG